MKYYIKVFFFPVEEGACLYSRQSVFILMATLAPVLWQNAIDR